MASIKKTRSGAFQLRVKNKLLPKIIWATFDTFEEAEKYGGQLERLLAQGIVPTSLLEQGPPKRTTWTIGRCIVEYIRHNAVPVSDVKLLDTIRPALELVGTGNLNYDWADAWITSMKREANLAPSTIRHRHGALARCFDWMLRKHPEILVQNPLRLLKRGFATYTDQDAQILAASGRAAREDIERDRRLSPDEEHEILRVLDGEDRIFFVLALETAMRMRECYTLDLSQVKLGMRTIYLESSKNGQSRQVPLSSIALALLDEHLTVNRAAIKARDGRLFPYWDGNSAIRELDRTSAEVSRVFSDAFEEAAVPDLHFHDLRHEATCRLRPTADTSEDDGSRQCATSLSPGASSAGHPETGRRPVRRRRAYPRVRGATRSLSERLYREEGLSPRARGNHRAGACLVYRPGSIPACARQPAPAGRSRQRPGVYPRVRGAT